MSATLPFMVTWFCKSGPSSAPSSPWALCQRPVAMVKAHWSFGVIVHTRPPFSGIRGHSWAGQVRLNVPALLPGNMQVCWAQFIPWPRLVNSAFHRSVELWFIIKVFNLWPVHIIPLKTEEQPSRCTRPSLRLILDGNHLDAADRSLVTRWSLSKVNNGCWLAVVQESTLSS